MSVIVIRLKIVTTRIRWDVRQWLLNIFYQVGSWTSFEILRFFWFTYYAAHFLDIKFHNHCPPFQKVSIKYELLLKYHHFLICFFLIFFRQIYEFFYISIMIILIQRRNVFSISKIKLIFIKMIDDIIFLFDDFAIFFLISIQQISSFEFDYKYDQNHERRLYSIILNIFLHFIFFSTIISDRSINFITRLLIFFLRKSETRSFNDNWK